MNVDGGGIERLVPEECLDGKKINAVLIKVRAKGMPQRMAGDAGFPSQTPFCVMNVP